MIELSRRKFTLGLLATLAAPAIVRATSIWLPPKKTLILPPGDYIVYIDEVFNVTAEGKEGLIAHLRTLVPQGPWGPKQMNFNINLVPSTPHQFIRSLTS